MSARNTIAILPAVALSLLSGVASSQVRPDPLTELSIEELLNVPVLSATRVRAMSARRTPGVVRDFTRPDAERYGFVTLPDNRAHVRIGSRLLSLAGQVNGAGTNWRCGFWKTFLSGTS